MAEQADLQRRTSRTGAEQRRTSRTSVDHRRPSRVTFDNRRPSTMQITTKTMTTVTIVSVILPISLCCWIITSAITSTSEMQSPFRWLMSLLLPVLITLHSLKKKKLDLTASLVALIIGFVLTISNFCFTTSLLIFFFTSTKLTEYKSDQKRQFEAYYNENAQRNWIQVISNGGVAAVLSWLYLLERGYGGEITIDFYNDYNNTWFAVATLGSIACSCGDTWASEIGSVHGPKDPILLIGLRRVPRGTNGAVSFVGLLVSFLGGGAVGLGYYLTILVFVPRNILAMAPSQWPVVITGAFAGLAGSLIDSVLGGYFQYSGLDRLTRKVVDIPSDRVKWISGSYVLDNHAVNLLSSLFTGLITPRIAMWTFSYFVPGSVPYH